MKIEDLGAHLSEMTDDQLMEEIRKIRGDRQISKHAVSVRQEREKKTKTKAEKALEGLTPEQLAQLLKELGEG